MTSYKMFLEGEGLPISREYEAFLEFIGHAGFIPAEGFGTWAAYRGKYVDGEAIKKRGFYSRFEGDPLDPNGELILGFLDRGKEEITLQLGLFGDKLRGKFSPTDYQPLDSGANQIMEKLFSKDV